MARFQARDSSHMAFTLLPGRASTPALVKAQPPKSGSPRLPPSRRKPRGSFPRGWRIGPAAHASGAAASHAALAGRSGSVPPCCQSNCKGMPWLPRALDHAVDADWVESFFIEEFVGGGNLRRMIFDARSQRAWRRPWEIKLTSWSSECSGTRTAARRRSTIAAPT
jgi:hypothetical protein